ncbi:MAG: phosphonate ABC transporter ATP-binding protein [Rhodocyclaceae bacterium]|nr:phosphonate ABC transporter ATP-binding protein [Rhodocyclaceae bacterium]
MLGRVKRDAHPTVGDAAAPVIRLDGVSMRYPGGSVALHPTTVDFHGGQFTALLGASGAGKSTLIRCINLLNSPSEGTVHVSGIGPIIGPRALLHHRRQTGVVFQQHQLIGRLSALRNVLTGRLGYHGSWRSLWPLPARDQRIALGCLERVGLLDKALERVDRLSGGQQQRVGIARALAQQPQIMLADEPVASLDPATARRVLTLLRDVCRQDGIPAVVSLHQLDLARAFADRIVALAEGKVVFDGPADAFGEAEQAAAYAASTLTPAAVTRRSPAGPLSGPTCSTPMENSA